MNNDNPYNNFRKDLGQELRRLRHEKGWTREDACAQFNIPNPMMLDRIEKGKSKRFFFSLRLIQKYGKKVKFLLSDNDDAEAGQLPQQN